MSERIATGVDEKIVSKTLEGTSSRIKDTSQSAEKSSERKEFGVDDKMVSGVGDEIVREDIENNSIKRQ